MATSLEDINGIVDLVKELRKRQQQGERTSTVQNRNLVLKTSPTQRDDLARGLEAAKSDQKMRKDLKDAGWKIGHRFKSVPYHDTFRTFPEVVWTSPSGEEFIEGPTASDQLKTQPDTWRDPSENILNDVLFAALSGGAGIANGAAKETATGLTSLLAKPAIGKAFGELTAGLTLSEIANAGYNKVTGSKQGYMNDAYDKLFANKYGIENDGDNIGRFLFNLADPAFYVTGGKSIDIANSINNNVEKTVNNLNKNIKTAGNKVYRTPLKVLGNKSIRSITRGIRNDIGNIEAIKNYNAFNVQKENITKSLKELYPEATVNIKSSYTGGNDIDLIFNDGKNQTISVPIEVLGKKGNVKFQGNQVNRFSLTKDVEGVYGNPSESKYYYDVNHVLDSHFLPYSDNFDLAGTIQGKVDEINGLLNGDGLVGGSSVIYGKNYASGLPGDIEIVTTESRYPSVKQKLQGYGESVHPGFGYKLRTPYGYDNGLNDVQIIQERNGKAYGPLAHEYYKRLFPEDYRKLTKELIEEGIPEGRVQRFMDDMELPISAEELYSKITPEVHNDKLLQDMFLSKRDKHMSRAYQMLTHPNKAIRDKARTSMKEAIQTHFGKDYKLGSEQYKNMRFDDIEANKAFLKYLDLPEEYATNPEIMRNIFDRWHIRETTLSRNVSFNDVKTIEELKKVMHTTYAKSGARAMGIGRNTVLYSGEGGWENASYTGVMTTKLTFNPEKFNNPMELVKQREFLHNFRKDNPEIYKMIDDVELDMINGKISEEEGLALQTKLAKEYDIPIYIGEDYKPGKPYGGAIVPPDYGITYPSNISKFDAIKPETGGRGLPNKTSLKQAAENVGIKDANLETSTSGVDYDPNYPFNERYDTKRYNDEYNNYLKAKNDPSYTGPRLWFRREPKPENPIDTKYKKVIEDLRRVHRNNNLTNEQLWKKNDKIQNFYYDKLADLEYFAKHKKEIAKENAKYLGKVLGLSTVAGGGIYGIIKGVNYMHERTQKNIYDINKQFYNEINEAISNSDNMTQSDYDYWKYMLELPENTTNDEVLKRLNIKKIKVAKSLDRYEKRKSLED